MMLLKQSSNSGWDVQAQMQLRLRMTVSCHAVTGAATLAAFVTIVDER